MVIDLHREAETAVNAHGEILVEIRDALNRLVAIEEARHAGETFLEAALLDGAGAGPIDLTTLDFVRTPDRKFLVRENGVLRDPTPAEAVALAGTVNHERRERRR